MQLPKLLLCTDLDRTLIPNGSEPESPGSRHLFKRFCDNPEVTLVYVSGRDKNLILEAIQEYDLPLPNYAITDVGSVIYEVENSTWKTCIEWTNYIAKDWGSYSTVDIHKLLSPISTLRLQEKHKQNTYKLSYYLSLTQSHTDILREIVNLLARKSIQCNIIWSIDAIKHIGLIDILPASANKLTAIQWLAIKLSLNTDEIIFSGDSGNDIDVISSEISSILVANASSDIKSQAIAQAMSDKRMNRLYIATGDFNGMNGNYAAGILEGICFFIPEVGNWLSPVLSSMNNQSS